VLFDGVIKKEDTLRKLLPLSTFLIVACSIVRKWSKARDPLDKNFKPFATEPSISLPQWTLAWNWKSQFKSFILSHPSNPDVWYTNARDGQMTAY
jgi:hypothetical protein